jgi:hypothetical protein
LNLEVHHKELRSQSGDDSEHNLITLCVACHSLVHGDANRQTKKPSHKSPSESIGIQWQTEPIGFSLSFLFFKALPVIARRARISGMTGVRIFGTDSSDVCSS